MTYVAQQHAQSALLRFRANQGLHESAAMVRSTYIVLLILVLSLY